MLGPWATGDLGVGRADDRLDFRAVDEARDIRVGDLGRWEEVVLLLDRNLIESTEDFIKTRESALSPDDETTNVSTRSKLEEIEALQACTNVLLKRNKS